MNNSCLVSVIMPVYMVEQFVEKSILSVLNQTYKNVELICIDDASTDESYSICQKLSSIYSNIVLLQNNENKGLEATRNRGLDAVNGKYFIFLDSDDTLAPETIETLVNAALIHQTDITMCTYSKIIDEQENPELTNLLNGKMSVKEFTGYLLEELPWSVLSCVGTKLYRTEMIRFNQIRFNSCYKYNEDCAFFLTALLCAEYIYYLNKPFYKYLIRKQNSIMSSYRKDMFVTNVRVVELCKTLFHRHGCWDKKQGSYYQKIYFLMLDSLINEIAFGDKKIFFRVAKQLCSYSEFDEMYKNIMFISPITIYHKILAKLLKNEKYNILFWIFKLRKILKSKSLLKKMHYLLWSTIYKRVYKIGLSDKKNNRIYMFHDISDKKTELNNYVSNINSFEKFLKHELKAGKVVSLDEVLKKKRSGCFAITFDDGFSGVYNYAYPLMKQLKVPFTIFVTTGYIDKKGFLTSKEILELSEEPLCTLAAHTISHPLLRFSKDAFFEISESKKILEDIIKKPVDFFAYPFGSIYACSNRNIKAAKKSGYRLSCSAINGCLNRFTQSKIHFLPRINGDVLVKEIEN